jgi:hypothetical protein
LFAVFSCNICRLVVQDSSVAEKQASKIWERCLLKALLQKKLGHVL